jgi:hypothetical protein
LSPLIRRALAFFLPVAVLVTALCGLVYLEVQQDLRSGANDPQYQLATDAATRLDGGTAPSSVVDSTPGVDLATDATLDGGRPAPPDGVLDAAGPSDPTSSPGSRGRGCASRPSRSPGVAAPW